MASLLAATAALFPAPALAASGRRRASGPYRRVQADARRSPRRRHRRRCVGSHDRIGRVRRAAIERATICLINRERTERGLPRVRRSRLLIRSAQRWTNTMVRHRAFSHGADFSARITAVGFNWSRAGENIAFGYRTASGVVSGWMRSLGHCQNILTPVFREAGAGFDRGAAIRGSRGTWTLDFALGMRQRARSENWGPAEGCPYRR